MHSVAARLAPEALKRVHQRWSDARFHRLVDGPTAAVVQAHGLTVSAGPFAGMRYLAGLESWSSDLVAKLTGQYERELHAAIAAWVALRPSLIVDVGCAEGFYAVGLARAIPTAIVHAHDVDADALERCGRLAHHNGVSDRVRRLGACTPATLRGLPEEGVALLVDAEGYERELLDPVAAPVLRGWHMIVELHEFLQPDIAEVVRERFAGTHHVAFVGQEPRNPDLVPALDGVPPRSAAALLSERRPAAMRWAILRPSL